MKKVLKIYNYQSKRVKHLDKADLVQKTIS
jgi:hypothetical protein